MINYKIQINYNIKIKHKACEKMFFVVATRVQLKDSTHMFCFHEFVSQTI
jgi:hypothetical protein